MRNPIACAVALFLSMAAARAVPTDLNFKDVDLHDIFQTIAVLGKFNVIVDPQVRSKMTVQLRQTEPMDALFLVARMQELRVKRVPWEEGTTTTTFAVGRFDRIEKSFEAVNGRTVQLKYSRAEEVAASLQRSLPKSFTGMVGFDARTNRLMMHGTEDALAHLSDLVRDLDLPTPAVQLKLTLLAGPEGKQTPIWSGTALVTQGSGGILRITASPAKSSGWTLAGIECQFTAQVNDHNFCLLAVSCDAKVERNAAPATAKLAANLFAQDKEEVTIGTAEIAPGETLQLRVRPEVPQHAQTAAPADPHAKPGDPASSAPPDDGL